MAHHELFFHFIVLWLKLGITPLMGRWLHDAGYQHIQHTPVAIEVSAQTDMHLHFVDQVEIYFDRCNPSL